MLLQKKHILNLILALIAFGLSVTFYLSWMRELPSISAKGSVEKKGVLQKFRVSEQVIPAEITYGAIVSQNVFAPDRKEYIPEQKALEEKEEKSVVAVEKVSGKIAELQGVIGLGDKYSGLIFSEKSKAEKKSRWVVVGDRVGGFLVTEIMPDRVLLHDGKKKYEIKLREKNKKRVVSHPGAKAAPYVASTGKVSDHVSGKKIKSKNSDNSSKEFKVIHTPFGDVVRKK